jgi:hypothetical protein
VSTETISRNEALHGAIALLASMCDGAQEQDGMGFNSLDTKFGKRIAAIVPEHWTEEIAAEASRILPVYRKQLERNGVAFDQLPLIKGVDVRTEARQQARYAEYSRNSAERKKRNAPYAVVRDGEIRVFNSFDIKEDLKGARAGYGFSGWDRAWVTTLSKKAAQILIDLGVELRDGAEQILDAADAEEVPELPGTVMYDRENNLIVITTKDRDVVPLDDMRALPGRNWDNVNNVNTCFPVPEVLDLALRYGLQVADLARDAIQEHAKRIAESSATETDFRTGTDLDEALRPYQLAGVAYMVKHLGAINADDMGLGKTVQAIVAFETIGQFPVLVTCPASLRKVWLREIAKWTPWRTAAISDGYDIPDTDYVIVSYQGMTNLVKQDAA